MGKPEDKFMRLFYETVQVEQRTFWTLLNSMPVSAILFSSIQGSVSLIDH